MRQTLVLIVEDSLVSALSAPERNQVTFTYEPDPARITFDAGLNGSTLTLSTAGDVSAGPSAFQVSTPIVIVGPGGNSGVTLSAAGAAMRLFDVTSTGNLPLQNLTLSGGIVKGLTGGTATGGGARPDP